MKKMLFRKLLLDYMSFFLIALFSASIVIWVFQAVNFLQRNRNWADGILFIPTSWARNEYTIAETLSLISLPTAVVYFNKSSSFGTSQDESILKMPNISSFTGDPKSACCKALDHLLN